MCLTQLHGSSWELSPAEAVFLKTDTILSDLVSKHVFYAVEGTFRKHVCHPGSVVLFERLQEVETKHTNWFYLTETP